MLYVKMTNVTHGISVGPSTWKRKFWALFVLLAALSGLGDVGGVFELFGSLIAIPIIYLIPVLAWELLSLYRADADKTTA